MARRQARPAAVGERRLVPERTQCVECGGPLWLEYRNERTVTTLDGPIHFTLHSRRCQHRACALFHRPDRPEAEGAVALPQAEFGLDVIALVGARRYAEHRRVPEIHTERRGRGVALCERSVTKLGYRYEALVALRLADQTRLRDQLLRQGRVLLALDGLPPEVGQAVLWVLRDCLAGEVFLARRRLSATQADLAGVLREVPQALPVPIQGVISDGQPSIRRAVKAVLPGVPQQVCHFHYLREAAQPSYAADRHAKQELKKQVRGVRPIERRLEGRTDLEAHAVRADGLAVRSALTDDGRPPLCAAGLRVHDRLAAIQRSIERVAEKRGCRPTWRAPALARAPRGPESEQMSQLSSGFAKASRVDVVRHSIIDDAEGVS